MPKRTYNLVGIGFEENDLLTAFCMERRLDTKQVIDALVLAVVTADPETCKAILFHGSFLHSAVQSGFQPEINAGIPVPDGSPYANLTKNTALADMLKLAGGKQNAK